MKYIFNRHQSGRASDIMKNIALGTLLLFFAAKVAGQDDVLHYEFMLRLNDTSDVVYARSSALIRLNGNEGQVSFHLRNADPSGKGMTVKEITVNGIPAEWTHLNDRLNVDIPSQVTRTGDVSFTITYSGIPSDGLIISRNKFGKRTFFSDHWPDRASCYLPVCSHLSDKAKVDFVIIAPYHYRVVANGMLVEESNLDEHNRLTHWKEEVPLPVKVMAFGAAPFAAGLLGYAGNVPVWAWVYPENRDAGFNDYLPAVKAVSFFDTLIGPYPFRKLANVQSKTIFGGLENASCIFYAENSVTGKGRAERLIAHEAVHQWFGNSVTEREWSHIWLSEGFATYLTTLYMELNYGREMLETNMKQSRNTVLRFYEKSPVPVIDHKVTDLMSLLNPNSYQKGAWVLHMLRRETGEENFREGIKTYYGRFRDSTALTSDFRIIMEKVSGRNLETFFHQWLEVAGQPDLKITTRKAGNRDETVIIIEQTQDHLFEFPIDLLLKTREGEKIINARIKEKTTEINFRGIVTEVIPDPETWLLFREAGK